MKKMLVGPIVALSLMLVNATAQGAAELNLTGTWTLGVEGDHVIPMALVLKQEGSRISGTIAMPTNQQGDRRDIAFDGEVTETGFNFSTREGTPRLEFVGKANDDGSLGGTVTVGGDGHAHKMTWTAERLKERKKG